MAEEVDGIVQVWFEQVFETDPLGDHHELSQPGQQVAEGGNVFKAPVGEKGAVEALRGRVETEGAR